MTKEQFKSIVAGRSIGAAKRARLNRQRFLEYVCALLVLTVIAVMSQLVARSATVSEAGFEYLHQSTEASPAQINSKSPGGAKPITFSVYAERYHERTAANGEPYNHFANTCAANFLPLGTVVVCRWGGREVEAVVTDRMDRTLGENRIDLSGGAMFELLPDYDFTDETATLLKGATYEVAR